MSLLGSFFGSKKAASVQSASAIDVVTYIASLASNPQDIDPLLDPLRAITSRLQPGQALSAADQATLATTYLKLEAHLIQHDPLRHFDKAGLQAKLTQKFPKPLPEEATFWKKIQTEVAQP